MDFAAILDYAKKNWVIVFIVGIAAILLLFPKQIKKLTRGKPKRRRRRAVVKSKTVTRGTPVQRRSSTSARTSSKGYAAVVGGYIPFKYNKDGSVKKAWQVGGTVAAKSRMARLRRSR